jgi:hypothetical protein
MEPGDPESPVEAVVTEVRTRRLAIVDAGGVERAAMEVGERRDRVSSGRSLIRHAVRGSGRCWRA